MKNLLLLIPLFLCGVVSNANDHNGPKGAKATTAVVELIIILGENNAGGRALNSAALTTELAARPSVQILNNITLTFQSIDIGYNNNLGQNNGATTSEHGLELGLTNQKEAGNLSNDVFVVKCGKNGGKIEEFIAGNSSGYWEESMTRIDAAIAYLDGLGQEYRITVWQSIGLNDWVEYDGNPNYPQQWKNDMNTFRSQFRSRYGSNIPFIITKFNQTVSGFPSSWNTAIQQLSDEDIPLGRAIDVSGAAFNTGDPSNWSYDGLKTIAARMVTSMNTLLGATTTQATYYVAPNGSNSNPGTLTAPFATWEKLSSVMVAGDVAYIRGGTYRTTKAASVSTHCQLQNLHGTATSMIKIWAYPGEFPVFNFDNITPSYSDPTCVSLINSEYVHIKGLRITGMKQHTSGSGITRGFHIENVNHTTIEFTEVDHMGGYGFYLRDGVNDNLFVNCDAHHLDDRMSNPGAWGGSNGFDCTGGVNATRNTFDRCRAWWVSDDGFDFYGTNGIQTLKNCWSFWNGFEPGTFIQRGDGDGFKLGPDAGGMHNTLLRTLTNCVAFENKQHGFNQNVGDMKYKLYNNTSFKNGATGYMWDFVSPAPVQDFRNNVSFMDAQARRGNETTGSFNTWNVGVTVTSGDFLSITSTGADGPRQSDGSLPVLNFLHLVPASDLVNSGTNVGLPYIGSAPDRGAYENGTVLPVKLVDLTASLRPAGVLLQWATVTEVNSDFFLVESSIDGINFSSLGTVNSNGNSTIRMEYNFTDISPKPGINYYRLKMVDRDGQYEYSTIVSATIKDNSLGSITFVTSELSNNMLRLNINSSKQQPSMLGLYDARGRLLFGSDIILQKGMNNIARPVFAAGAIYYCKLMTAEESKTATLLKR
ncbi:MAG: right-handed parallel beta-helix repeat-containing protein [Ferruginibacter sp.]